MPLRPLNDQTPDIATLFNQLHDGEVLCVAWQTRTRSEGSGNSGTSMVKRFINRRSNRRLHAAMEEAARVQRSVTFYAAPFEQLQTSRRKKPRQ